MDSFLSNHNGVTIFSRQQKLDSQCLHFYSDASKTAFGATYQNWWIQGHWPAHWTSFDIMVLEMYPIYIMLSIFASQLANTHVVFHCDNLDDVYVLNNKSSSNDKVMTVVQAIILLLLLNNINITARHIHDHHLWRTLLQIQL